MVYMMEYLYILAIGGTLESDNGANFIESDWGQTLELVKLIIRSRSCKGGELASIAQLYHDTRRKAAINMNERKQYKYDIYCALTNIDT